MNFRCKRIAILSPCYEYNSEYIAASFSNYCSVDLIILEKNELRDALNLEQYDAYIVTSLYRRDIIEFVDDADDSVKRLGLADFVIRSHTKLIAFLLLRDAVSDILRSNIDADDAKIALLLEDGINASVVRDVLASDFDADPRTITKDGLYSYENINLFRGTRAIISSEYIKNDSASKIDAELFCRCKSFIDLSLSEPVSPIASKFASCGIKTIFGFECLVQLTRRSLGSLYPELDLSDIEEVILKSLQRSFYNIALITCNGELSDGFAYKIADISSRHAVCSKDVYDRKSLEILYKKPFGEYKKYIKLKFKKLFSKPSSVISMTFTDFENFIDYTDLQENCMIVIIYSKRYPIPREYASFIELADLTIDCHESEHLPDTVLRFFEFFTTLNVQRYRYEHTLDNIYNSK